jgi:thiamine-phosphate diphosphorylase
VEDAKANLYKKEILGLSKVTGAVIVASGSKVTVGDAASNLLLELPGGSSMQKLFTGAGCMMSAVIGAYLGAAKKEGETDDCVNAIRAAVSVYQINAARAELFCQKEKRLGTMHYKNALIDQLSLTRLSRRERLSGLDTFLYAITNRDILKEGISLTDAVEQAILGGATMIQLREKNMTTTEYIKTAIAVNKVCESFDIPLIINDNVEVCRVVGAAGVHLGLEDESVEKARAILGEDFIIGATAHNLKEAQKALLQGADYLGVGAAFGSDTKKDAKPITSLETYKEITSNIPIPVVAIGGITGENLGQLSGLGLSGIAVISSIFGALDIKENTKSLKQKAKEEILK